MTQSAAAVRVVCTWQDPPSLTGLAAGKEVTADLVCLGSTS